MQQFRAALRRTSTVVEDELEEAVGAGGSVISLVDGRIVGHPGRPR